MSLYATSFEKGAFQMMDHMLDDGLDLDTLVYPTLHCLVHALELNLKSTIKKATLLSSKNHKNIPKNHSIDKLWELLTPLITELFPKDDKSISKNVNRCLAELTKINQLHMAFRYPEDLKGTPLLKEYQYVDIGNLRKTSKGIFIFLNGINYALQERIDLIQYE